MIFETLGNAIKKDLKVYEFNSLCIDGNYYKLGADFILPYENDGNISIYKAGKIIKLKATMDYKDPIAVVFDEDNDIISHYELD